MKKRQSRSPDELRRRAFQMRARAKNTTDPVEVPVLLALAEAYEQVALGREAGRPLRPPAYTAMAAPAYFEDIASRYRAIARAIGSAADRKRIESIAAKYEARAAQSRLRENAAACATVMRQKRRPSSAG